jgi:hypothetical protein
MNAKKPATKPAAPSLPEGFTPIGGDAWKGGDMWFPHLDPADADAKCDKIDNAAAVCDPAITGVLRRVKAFGRESFTIGGCLVPDHGMLAARLATVEDGAIVAASYLGTQKIEKGQYRGKSAHAYLVGAKAPF